MEAAASVCGEVTWGGAAEMSAAWGLRMGILLWLGPGQVSPGKKTLLQLVLWPVYASLSLLLDSKEPLMMSVGTKPSLSDISADGTHTDTYLPPLFPAFSPCRGCPRAVTHSPQPMRWPAKSLQNHLEILLSLFKPQPSDFQRESL